MRKFSVTPALVQFLDQPPFKQTPEGLRVMFDEFRLTQDLSMALFLYRGRVVAEQRIGGRGPIAGIRITGMEGTMGVDFES